MNAIENSWLPPNGKGGAVEESRERARSGTGRRAFWIVALLLVLIGASLYAWRDARTAPPPPRAALPLPVAAAVVSPSDIPATIETIGFLRAVREVQLAPEVAGRIVAINFRPGARVTAGTLLAQLYDAPERADLNAAQARVELTRAQLARSEQLAPTGAEPRQVLQQRRADHAQAAAAVRQVAARLSQKQVRAPFSGEIGISRADLGQFLNPGEAIAQLTALDSLYVEFSIPQQDLRKVHVGSTVTVASEAWPGRSFRARVNAIDPVIGEDTRNVRVQAVVPNADRSLRPGMSVTAALDLPPERGALLVPATAIQVSASGESVTVVRGPRAPSAGKAEIVAVTTGRRIGDRIVVVAGLRAGDVVITEGQTRIRPGAEVAVAAVPLREPR